MNGMMYGNYFLENMILNTKDIEYNLDKFKSGSSKLLFITGHSGSGKSTLARNLAKDLKVNYIELDDIYGNWNFTDDQLKEYDPIIYDFFSGSGKRFRKTEEPNNQGNSSVDNTCKEFILYLMTNAKERYIVEGVEIYFLISENRINIDKFKQYSMIVKGTSGMSSAFRATKRNSSNKKTNTFDLLKMYFDHVKWASQDEPMLNNIKKNLKS